MRSPDSVVLNPELTDPQLWNKYSYGGNSPSVKVDPDGRWPTWFHHQLDEEFFGKNLGLSKLSVWDIEQGSDWVDGLGCTRISGNYCANAEHSGHRYRFCYWLGVVRRTVNLGLRAISKPDNVVRGWRHVDAVRRLGQSVVR